MADKLPPLQQIDPDIFRQGTPAFKELVAIKANVYVLLRPPLFVPGTEPLRIEGTVERILPNNILRVNTDLGSFAVRLMDNPQIDRHGQVVTEAQNALPMNGAKLAVTISPSGASARLEAISLAVGSGGVPSLPDASLPHVIAAHTARTSMAPPVSPLLAEGTRPNNAQEPLGLKGLTSFYGSAIGAQRQSELWFKSDSAADENDKSAFRSSHSTRDISRAFAEAGGLTRPSDAHRITTSFGDSTRQTFYSMMEMLAIINPMAMTQAQRNMPRDNSSFGAGILFFLLSLKHGGINRWLEATLAPQDERDKSGYGDYFDRQFLAHLVHIEGQGSWRVTLIPFMARELSQIVWAVKERPHGAAEHFALQLVLPHVGPIQISGYTDEGWLNLLLLSLIPFPYSLERLTGEAAFHAFKNYGFEGTLSYSSNTQLWLPFLEALHFERRV